jgi:lipopolysaccharide transport system permease protein
MSDGIITIIEARPKTVGTRLLALWQFRGFYPFLFKEITMRKFRGTLLGFWWLIIRPLVPTVMAIVTFAFIVPIESHGLPYAVFYFSGFITWNVFHATVNFMPRTMLWMQAIMRRTYFPRLLVPFASLGPPLIETALMLGLFALLLIFFQVTTGTMYLQLSWNLLWFPLCLLLALMLAIAVGMITSVMALFVRDIIFTVAYFAQILMFLTPVLYPVSFIPETYRWILYVLNPMAELVEASRWALTGQGDFSLVFLAISAAMVLSAFALSVAFFLRAERYLADEM